MPVVTTIFNDDKKVTCLICNTSHTIGKRVFPLPKCKCGNISFFDITESYIRYCFNWYKVFVTSKENWQLEILKQISENDKPSRVIDYDGQTYKLDLL